jgi:hypothetical protein
VPVRPSQAAPVPAAIFFHTFSYWSDPVGSPLSFNSIVVASPEQVSCPLGDESAILNLKNSVYYGMNPVGTRVWTLLKQPRTIADVRDAIVDEYDVDSDRCGQDVLELLEKLRGEGLIEVRETSAG